MTTNEIMSLRSQIEARLNDLEAVALTARSELRASSEINTNAFHDELDYAKCEVELKTTLEIHNHNLMQQISLRTALAKMHTGTFGVCLPCGKMISTKRLEASPGAARCIECLMGVDFDVSVSRIAGWWAA
jgi:DnaK suppressor protein